jgi:hypothetical protein
LRPGVVAIEYIDWMLAVVFMLYCRYPSFGLVTVAKERSGFAVFDIVGNQEGLTTIKKSAALPATAHLAGTPNLTL